MEEGAAYPLGKCFLLFIQFRTQRFAPRNQMVNNHFIVWPHSAVVSSPRKDANAAPTVVNALRAVVSPKSASRYRTIEP